MSEENQEVQHHQVAGESQVPAEARYCDDRRSRLFHRRAERF